jgi:hypothetical protein
LVEAMRRKHGLGDALSSSAHQAINEQTYGPVVAAIRQILDAGKQDGSIRMDADPGDFLQFTGALWRATSSPEDRSPRMLAPILDGLRTQPHRNNAHAMPGGRTNTRVLRAAIDGHRVARFVERAARRSRPYG